MESASAASKSIGIDALFQYTGSGVQLFSGMVFYMVITRLFSTTSVGAIALFVAIIGLFNVVFSFGLGTAAQHFTSFNLGRGDYPSVKRTIYKILGFGFTFSFIGFLTLLILSSEISLIFLHSTSYGFLVKVLSIVLVGNILFGILNGSLLGIQNFRLSAIINIVIWTSYYFGSILFALYIRSLDTIVFGWMAGIFIGVGIELAVVMASLRRYNGPGTSPRNLFLFAYSLPVLFSGLISYGAAYADRFVVSGLMSLSSLGVYNFSLLIASSIGFIAVPFNNILMPKFSELFAKNKIKDISSIVNVSSTLLSSIYVPAALGIAALGPILIQLLAGGQYVSGSTALRIIMIFSALCISQNILAQAIGSVRKTKIFLYSSLAAFSINIFLSFMLIPRYGLVGAAIAFSSVYAVSMVVLYLFARKYGVVSFDVSGLSKIWASSIIMFLFVYLFRELLGASMYLLPMYICVGIAVYLVSARLLKPFGEENKELVLSLFPSNYRRVKKAISFLMLH